jgi:hypothetical protein
VDVDEGVVHRIMQLPAMPRLWHGVIVEGAGSWVQRCCLSQVVLSGGCTVGTVRKASGVAEDGVLVSCHDVDGARVLGGRDEGEDAGYQFGNVSGNLEEKEIGLKS